MAVTTAGTVAEINATTVEDLETQIEDQTRPDNIWWFKFVQERGWKKLKQGSHVLSHSLIVDTMDDQIVDYHPDNVNLSFTKKNIIDKGKWYWKYSTGLNVYGELELKENKGKTKRVEMIKTHSDALNVAFRRRMIAQIFGCKTYADVWNEDDDTVAGVFTDATDGEISTTDTNSLRMIGLPVIVSTTKNYAGLNPSTVTTWKARSGATWSVAAVSDITLPAVASWITNCVDGNAKDKIIGLRPLAYQYFCKLLYPNQRYGDNKELTKVGFTSMEFNGVSFVPSWDVPNGSAQLIDTKFIELFFDPSAALSAGEVSYIPENKEWVAEVNSMCFLRCLRRKFTHGRATGNGLLDSNIAAALVA